LRVALERGGLLLLDRLLATLADQLVNGSQSFSPSTSCVFGVFVCAQLMCTQKQASSKDANENSTIRTWRCQTPRIRACPSFLTNVFAGGKACDRASLPWRLRNSKNISRIKRGIAPTAARTRN